MKGGQLLQSRGTLVGQCQPDDTAIIWIVHAPDQAQRTRTLRKLDGTVVPEQKVPGHIADRWPAGIVMPADGQQQLMVCWGQAHSLRLLLTPAEVLAQACPQLQQPLVILVLQLKPDHQYDVTPGCPGAR